MNLRAEGRQLVDADTGILVALCQDQADALAIVEGMRFAQSGETAIRELATAAGLPSPQGWDLLDAVREVTRQVRMVRRVSQQQSTAAMFGHQPTVPR